MPERAVYTGSMKIGRNTIPISVYKTQDMFGLPASEYHFECGGKIRQKRYCELHEHEEESPVSYTAIAYEGHLIEVDSEVRNELFLRKAGLEYVSAYPLKNLAFFDQYFPIECFRVSGNASTHTNFPHDSLYSVLTAMKRRKVFLLMTCGLSGMKRYCILMPNGYLVTLHYAEELRPHLELVGEVNKTLLKQLDLLFGTSTPFPELTLAPYSKALMSWLRRRVTTHEKRIAKTNPKKRLSEGVSV